MGAEQCASCHPAQHQDWRGSPHGRSLRSANEPGAVVGDFSGQQLAVGHGTVEFRVEAGRATMRIHAPAASDRFEDWPVDFVLASGRQHQLYLTATDSGLTILPAIWLTQTERWVSSSAYVQGSLDPGARDHWRRASMLEHACLDCHVSQARLGNVARGDPTRWLDAAVNCEACHGPGRAHVAAVAAGEARGSYLDLRTLTAEEEARRCGACHGLRMPLRVAGEPPERAHFMLGLSDPHFRVDGTQGGVAYQYAGHALSACAQPGALRCSSCHDPHSGQPRDAAGRSARPPFEDRQCTVCHGQFADSRAALEHSRHPPEQRCIDCHMARSWIKDEPRLGHATADHTISIPRPREAQALGLGNACGDCHVERGLDWQLEALHQGGATRSLEIREWLVNISAARQGHARVDELWAMAADTELPLLLRQSALHFLQENPAVAAEDPGGLSAGRRQWLRDLTRAPEVELRYEALALLMRIDGGAREHWRRRALADESPLVALMAFAEAPSGDPAELQAFIDGLRTHAAHPPFELVFGTAARLIKAEQKNAAAELLNYVRTLAPPGLAREIPRLAPNPGRGGAGTSHR